MPLGVTKNLEALSGQYSFQGNHIERSLDDAAYTAAHPDDTLILAGPARKSEVSENDSPKTASVALLPIGMLQQITWSQQKPTQPMMAIGSGRVFFTSGKATTSWSAARLWVNGRNLLRVLYQNAVALGLDVSKFDDPAAIDPDSKQFLNLDSELYYMPFGMACLFRNKAHDWLGSFYVEMCMVVSWGSQMSAGGSQILEQVSGVADRILPYDLSEVAANTGVKRSTVDRIIGFVADPSSGTEWKDSPNT